MSVALSDSEFRRCCDLIHELTGIRMTDAKRQLVERRLGRRLSVLGMTEIERYLELVRSGNAVEVEQFRNAVTTNLTSFFRENHHFDYLANVFLPALRERAPGRRKLRVWSAGCSTGEEPHSIAITLLEALPDAAQWDIRIVCTDIDTEVLATAEAAIYADERVEGLQPERLRRWFLRGRGARSGMVRLRQEVRDLQQFSQMNLMDPWPFRDPFDVIFCRNVVIYFSRETQARLVSRFAQCLSDDGILVMGHSESLNKISDRFRLLGRTIYAKEH